jgi:shikimate kinase
MVLTGPAGAGKTNIGLGLSARSTRPFIDLDACAHDYYVEIGWSMDPG